MTATAPERGVEHKHVVVDRMLVMVNGASSVGARLLNLFVLVFVYKYLLGRVTPEEFAIYPVVMSMMTFAPLFFTFFTGGVSRYVVAAYAVDDRPKVVEIVSSMTPLLLVWSTVFLIGGLILAQFVGPLLAIPPELAPMAALMMSLLVVSYAIQMVLLPFSVGFQVRQRFLAWNALWLGRDILRIVLLFAFLWLNSASVVWVVVATVAADIVHLIAITIGSTRMARDLKFRWRSFRWSTARTLVSFGLWTTLGRLAQMFYISAGTLVLSRFGTAVDVVNYYFAAALFQNISGLLTFARQPLQPSLIAMHSLADRTRLRRASIRGTAYGLWAALLVATPLAILSHDVVSLLLEPTYADAALVLVLLMAIFPFSQSAGLLPMIAVAMGEVRAFNVAALASTLAGFVAMLVAVLVFDGGAVGVAASLFAVTAVAQVVYFWPMNLRLVDLPARDFWGSAARGVMPALAGSLIWAPVAIYAPADWLALIIGGGAGGVVYMLVLVLFCLDPSDRALVQRIKDRLLPGGPKTQPA